jgi:hypothetical protein
MDGCALVGESYGIEGTPQVSLSRRVARHGDSARVSDIREASIIRCQHWLEQQGGGRWTE